MSRILFSPVGGTDPIRNYHDGSLLHIIRHYKPDRIILFFSGEMYERHLKDNRYIYCIDQLKQLLKLSVEIEILHSDVTVQDYEVFYIDFRKIFWNITETMHSDDELIVNIASGTPAMKSALVLLAGMGEFRFRAIQVSTPLQRSNYTDENVDEYDPKEQWECDMDNEPEAPNRCVQVQSANLQFLLEIDAIKHHLLNYDYSAALALTKKIQDRLDTKALRYVEQAFARSTRDYELVSKLSKKTKYMPIPVETDKEREAIEYILALKIKVLRRQYDDFIRGISPIIMDLMDRALKVGCKINYHNYCSYNNRGVESWNLNKLQDTDILVKLQNGEINPMFSGKRRETVYSRHLKTLINAYCKDQNLVNYTNALRTIEEEARNKASHTLVIVTDAIVKSWTGYSSQKIIELLMATAEKTGLVKDHNIWNSYDVMNQDVIEVLKNGII